MHYILIAASFVLNFRGISATLNSTESSTQSGWFSPPNLRGTADILWNCLSTLFICVYVVLHLNVPAPSDGELRIILRKIGLMFIGVLAPEFITWYAVDQYSRAQRSTEEIQNLHRGQWTITHSFYANMGGFVVHPQNSQDPLVLDAQGIKSYVTDGVLELPTISEHEIKDKSKADRLAKAIACLQAASVVVQCIARLAQRLPISSLEFVTLGYVLCAFVIYWYWWDKPLDVMIPTTITVNTDLDLSRLYKGPRIHNTALGMGSDIAILPYLVGNGVVLVLGGIQCIAWNFCFPSPIEQLLWRISLVLSTFLGVVLCIWLWVRRSHIEAGAGKALAPLSETALDLTILLYAIARIYLVVEIFISFRLAPANLYQSVDWLAFVPHV